MHFSLQEAFSEAELVTLLGRLTRCTASQVGHATVVVVLGEVVRRRPRSRIPKRLDARGALRSDGERKLSTTPPRAPVAHVANFWIWP